MTFDETRGDAKMSRSGKGGAEHPLAALRGYVIIIGAIAGSFLLLGALDFLKLWAEGDPQTRDLVSTHLWLTTPILIVGAGLGITLALGFFSAVGRFITTLFAALFTPTKRP